MEEIKALQLRYLQSSGRSSADITSEKFDIALGKEHEQDSDGADVEMFKAIYNA